MHRKWFQKAQWEILSYFIVNFRPNVVQNCKWLLTNEESCHFVVSNHLPLLVVFTFADHASCEITIVRAMKTPIQPCTIQKFIYYTMATKNSSKTIRNFVTQRAIDKWRIHHSMKPSVIFGQSQEAGMAKEPELRAPRPTVLWKQSHVI